MKRPAVFFSLALSLLTVLPASARPVPALRLAATRPAVRPGEWVVKFAPGTSDAAAQTLLARVGVSLSRIPELNVSVVRTTGTQAVSALARDPRVLWMEPNRMRYALSVAEPNDPAYNTLDTTTPDDPSLATWYKWDAHLIQAHDAWAIWPNKYFSTTVGKSSPKIRIAIIDTGIDYSHPDFKNAGATSTDSGKGGQLDTSLDKTITGGKFTSKAPDAFGHGTHVAGIAAASVNNGQGTTGTGYNATILSVRVLDANGDGTEADIASGIVYAADHGALIENLSLGGYGFSQVEADAVNYAWSRGTLCIAAAGNDGVDSKPVYPAALPRVLGVSATGAQDELALYSDFGDGIGVAAPGGNFDIDYGWYLDVYSAMPTYYVTLNDPNVYGASQTYAYLEGTSMASPQVAGLAALYAGYKKYTPSTPNGPLLLWQALQKSADDVGGGPEWNSVYGFGRINAYNMLHLSKAPNPRHATAGCITGLLYYKGTRVANGAITATPTAGGQATSATTRADGGYRIVNAKAGLYTLTATVYGESQTYANVPVSAGCDTPGFDFNVGAPVLTPTLTKIAPTSANANAGGFPLSVTGTNFLPSTVLQWNGTALTTQYLSATLVMANVPAGLVTTPGPVSITATNPAPGGASSSKTLTVKPAALSGLSVSPSSVTGGTASVGKATLSAPAPIGGFVVSLSSPNLTVAAVPATVTVPAGATSATFPVTTYAVTASTPVVLTVQGGGVTKTTTLTVTP